GPRNEAPWKGRPRREVQRHWTEIRPSTRRASLGTECSQPAWVAPPITWRSPPAGAMSGVGPRWGAPRAAGAQGEQGGERVAPPAQVGVPVEGLAVTLVPVPAEGEPVERDPVAPAQ